MTNDKTFHEGSAWGGTTKTDLTRMSGEEFECEISSAFADEITDKCIPWDDLRAELLRRFELSKRAEKKAEALAAESVIDGGTAQEWRDAFWKLHHMAVEHRCSPVTLGEWRGVVPNIVDMGNVETLRADAAESERDQARAERDAVLHNIQNWCVIELAIRNYNVSSYMDEWEGRATLAEAQLSTARTALITIRDWNAEDCHCDHADENCCAKVTGIGCSFCTAELALTPLPGQPERQRVSGMECDKVLQVGWEAQPEDRQEISGQILAELRSGICRTTEVESQFQRVSRIVKSALTATLRERAVRWQADNRAKFLTGEMVEVRMGKSQVMEIPYLDEPAMLAAFAESLSPAIESRLRRALSDLLSLTERDSVLLFVKAGDEAGVRKAVAVLREAQAALGRTPAFCGRCGKRGCVCQAG